MILDNIGLLTVTLLIVVFGGSMIIGKIVQTKTHFIWPHDIISIILLIVSACDISYRLMIGMDVLPWHPYLWVFIWLGYFGGFFIASRKDYIHLLNVRAIMDNVMTQDEIERNKWMRKFAKRRASGIFMPYIVPYQIGAKWYIRIQTNRDLLKDWIYGVKCEVDTNGDLKASMEFVAWHPWFPMPRITFLPVEVFDMGQPEILRKDKHIKLKKYTATILIAPAGMATSLDVLFNHLAAHQMDIIAVHNAYKAKLKAELTIPRTVADQVVKTVTTACLQNAPGVMLYENAKAIQDRENKPQEPPSLKKLRRSVFGRRNYDKGVQP